MRKETANLVRTAPGAYSALLGLSYIEKFNNESLARANGEERFDFDFYTTESGAQYWQNHNNFLSLSGKIVNNLLTADRNHLCELIQRRQDSVVIHDGTEEGYSVSRNLLNVMNPYLSDSSAFTPIESTMVSIASLIGLGLEAQRKTEDALINQEYVGIPTDREVVYTNAIINDEGGTYIEGFVKSIVEDDKKLFPESPNLGGVTMMLSEARMMDVTQ